MGRIAPVLPEEAGSDIRRSYDAIESMLGRISNMYRTMARWPGVLNDFVVYSSHFLANAPSANLDPRLKRLIHLRVSSQNECEYCTVHNGAWAAAQGIEISDIGRIRAGTYESSETLPESYKAACAWADAVTANRAKQDDALYARIQRSFTDEEIVELTLTIAYRNMVNRFVDALAVDIDRDPVKAEFAILDPSRVGEIQRAAREKSVISS